MDVETIAREVVDCAFVLHRDLGPGLLESVYEAVLAKSLDARGGSAWFVRSRFRSATTD